MSPWIEGRGCVAVCVGSVSSSFTFLPRLKLTISVLFATDEAPVRAMVTFDALKSTRPGHGALAHVFMVRFTTKGAVAAGSLPLRRTSAAEPFSTTPPSGRSLKVLLATEVHVPALTGEKSQ